jgi:hypothetical protein
MLVSQRLNRNLLEYSTDCIKVLDLEARLLFMNGLGCKALEIDDFDSVVNAYWLDFWKGTATDAVRAALETQDRWHRSLPGPLPDLEGNSEVVGR